MSNHTKKSLLCYPANFIFGFLAICRKKLVEEEWEGTCHYSRSVTTDLSDTSAVVRDEDNKLSGRTSERYDTTGDAHGNLVSINSADPGFSIGRNK